MSEVFILADQGQSPLTIAVSAADRGRLGFAADELQRYLAVITGAWLPVGETDGPALRLAVEPAAREQHGWRVSPEGLTLHGDCPLSVLHAVYAFLEAHAGCRWLSEFEGGEVVPRCERLAVPCEERSFTPAMAHRAFTNFPDIDRRTVAMVDWMAKRRFNRFMVFANMGDSFARYEDILRREVVARGLQVELGHHSFRFFLPPEELFAAHPEYYAELGGQRRPDGQLCTSHPAVAEIMAERVCRFFGDHPEIGTIGLWPNDGYGWCECAQCQALEPQEASWPYAEHPRRTDTYLRFVNDVASVVAREHPDRRLSALAYVNYVQPPRAVVPAPNVEVCFAPFQRCFKHPLAAPEDCARRNRGYADLLAQWRALTPGKLYLFEYLMLIDMCSLPYPLTGLLPTDFRDYAALGVDGFVLEFKPEEWGLYGVNANLMGALAWEPQLDAGEFLGAHYADLYGPAAAEMTAYFAELQRLLVDLGPCVGHYSLEYTRRATTQLLRPAAEHLGRAMVAVAGAEPRYRDRVHEAQVGFQLLLRVAHWRRLVAEAEAGPKQREAALRDGAALGEWTRAKERRDVLDARRIGNIIERERQRLSG